MKQPRQEHAVEELSVDGGNIRVQTPSISGAQWKRENVPQVLAHRCAYLNGLLSV